MLAEAIEKAFGQLQAMPESAATLGMIDSHPGGEEDYLVVGPRHAQKRAAIQARINRPERRLAKQLISEGAMVASGILLGYAQAFAARIDKYWPHLAQELIHALEKDPAAEVERKFSAFAYRQIPRWPCTRCGCFPDISRAGFPVQGSDWCSRQFSGI